MEVPHEALGMRAHVDRTAWQDQAACRDWSESVFLWDSGSRNAEDPLERRRLKKAKAICARCPVRLDCLEYALNSERAGKTKLGMAQFLWREMSKGTQVGTRLIWREFTASVTPPYGVWGGFTATERHRRDIKHLELVDGVCSRGRNCVGCRDTKEWIELLMTDGVGESV